MRGLVAPPHFVQAHGVVEAFEQRLTAVGVSVALAGQQVKDGLGGGYPAPLPGSLGPGLKTAYSDVVAVYGLELEVRAG